MAKVTRVPYNVLLLMDVSGSAYSYRKMMKKAAVEFTREISPDDRIAVASFNSRVRLLQDFTLDRRAVEKSISRLYPEGSTAFYDALVTSVDRYMRSVEGRKAIVIFTDGVDNVLEGKPKDGSRTSFDQLYSRLEESSAIIYPIFLDSEGKALPPSGGVRQDAPRFPKIGPIPLPFPIPRSSPSPVPRTQPPSFPAPKPGAKSSPKDRMEYLAYSTAFQQLKSIAKLTGGRMYSLRRLEDLSKAYAAIAEDLSIQYLLSYTSSNTAEIDGWRSIRVMVKDHPEAVVRTREGYYVHFPLHREKRN